MKKQLLVACGLAVLATPAFATKARLEALGEDNFGSYYINDNRNQFLNPAKINDQKDLVTYEFGRTSTSGTSGGNPASTSATAADSPSSPKSEAGFNKSWNNMVYGLHFGNTTPTAAVTRALAGSNLQEKNAWDLFVGGDAGVKWGANLTHEHANQGIRGAAGSRVSSNALRGRVGVVAGDLEVLAHYSFMGDAKDYAGNMVEGNGSWLLGAGYMVNSYKLFADYKHVATDYSNTAPANGSAAVVKKEWSLDEVRLGVARQERLNDKATLFARLTGERLMISDDGTGYFGSKADNTRYVIPLNVGLEYDAASWLVLRTSVGQYLWSKNTFDASTTGQAGKDQKRTLSQTAVRAGASLKFGEFTVDGLISTNSAGDGSTDGNAGTPANGQNNGVSTNGGNGSLRTDQLMSRVSMTYRF